jgi:hypothetical protein
MPAEDPERLRAVATAVDALLIAYKTFHLFPFHNINVKQSVRALTEALAAFHRTYGEPLVLDTTTTELQYHGTSIFKDPNRTRTLSYRLNQDGVSQLVVDRGVEPEELIDLLDVLRRVMVLDDDEDDFATLFWERDCTHLQIVTHDAVFNPATPLAISPAESLPTRIFALPAATAADELTTSAERAPQLPFAAEAPPAEEAASAAEQVLREQSVKQRIGGNRVIWELSQAESADLRALCEQEAAASPVAGMVDTLMRVYEAEPTDAALEHVARLLRTALDGLVVQEDYDAACRLAGEIAAAARRLADPAAAARLAQVVEQLPDRPAMQSMIKYLRDPRRQPPPELYALLQAVGRGALSPLLAVFFEGHHCAALQPLLAQLGGRAAAAEIAAGLELNDAAVVAHTIDLLMAVDPDGTPERLERLLNSRSANLRLKVLAVLADVEQRCRPELFELLGDADPEVRRTALAAVGQRPQREAFSALWNLYERGAGLSLSERTNVLALAVRADPRLAAELLARILGKRPLLGVGRRELEAEQRCVAGALAQVPDPAVLALLATHAERGTKHVQALCRAALVTLERGGSAAPRS